MVPLQSETSASYKECLKIENIVSKVQEVLYAAMHTNGIIPLGIRSCVSTLINFMDSFSSGGFKYAVDKLRPSNRGLFVSFLFYP
uniref:Uncharacterized protein n=1 Tax=Lepeophtheirus salmonis TaxID=72036 RepID=A0A0K2UAX7_LEPSM